MSILRSSWTSAAPILFAQQDKAVKLPLPDVRSGWIFWGLAGLFAAYLLYIVVRRPKPERKGAPADPSGREL